MTEKFEESALWRSTLAQRDDDPAAAQREVLRSSFMQARRAAEALAGEIAISMPDYTDHSVEHIDALWDTASLVVGPEHSVTPAEAFVLGGAFLLHDLGMGAAAFEGGQAAIEADPLFVDLKASLLRQGDMAEAEVAKVAMSQVLRQKHAAQAQRLASQSFSYKGISTFLIQDTGLRTDYGKIIGRIAHSHWFSMPEVIETFRTDIGALSGYPYDWKVDPFKVACILRLADAAQIDSRRAPVYRRIFRSPSGISADHWTFQSKLTQPLLENDRLKYTATSSFEVEESEAWWLAFETIKMINEEFRQVDAACADLGKPRFPVKSVAGAETPARFSRYVETEGWNPIDARLKVSDVNRVVENLGGAALYGNNPIYGLRELISNAADSTRARQIGSGVTPDSIRVELIKNGDEWVITVRDFGIGMTASQLVENLTDFGKSNWTSLSKMEEHPGLLASGYRATGKFGVGFYASFILADHVEVRSLKSKGASADTAVLVFKNGVRSRPLLRIANEHEQLDSGGTEVRLFLKQNPASPDGLLGSRFSEKSINEVLRGQLASLCALLDMNLSYRGFGEKDYRTIVEGNAWKSAEPEELFSMLYSDPTTPSWQRMMYLEYRDGFVENLETIYDDAGEIVGRVAFPVRASNQEGRGRYRYFAPQARIFVGGMFAEALGNMLGAFVGSPLTADRNAAFPIASLKSLQEWAESQGRRVAENDEVESLWLFDAQKLINGLGIVSGGLPAGFSSSGPITFNQLQDWLQGKDQLYILSFDDFTAFEDGDDGVRFFDRDSGQWITLPDNALITDKYTTWLLPPEVESAPVHDSILSLLNRAEDDEVAMAQWWAFIGTHTTSFQVIRAASEAWGCSLPVLATGIEFLESYLSGGDTRLELTCEGGKIARVEAWLVSRPTS